VRHLQQRDIEAIDKLMKNLKLSDQTKALCKKELIWDIYGKRSSVECFENGIAEAIDEMDFNAKLISLKPRWDKLCPGFYAWFLKNRKSDFISSVIQSAREGTNVQGLYYQNDIESQHAREKRIQNFKKRKCSRWSFNGQEVDAMAMR
jgi:hypothetical protein